MLKQIASVDSKCEMSSAGTGSVARLRHSLKSTRPGETSLPGDEVDAQKGTRPAPLALWHVGCSTLANVMVPMVVSVGNLLEWGRMAAAAWYCLPKMALLIAKLLGVAWLSRTHSLAPEKKDIDLDRGGMKYALYLWRALVDIAVAPLWYHFLEGNLFSITAKSSAVGVLLGAGMWMLWLGLPKCAACANG